MTHWLTEKVSWRFFGASGRLVSTLLFTSSRLATELLWEVFAPVKLERFPWIWWLSGWV